jgi:protoheme IX farnesyltransferase
MEREHDAKMRRTCDRPLPSGRMTPEAVLIIGSVCGAFGMVYLALTVNLLTALLGAATMVSYLFVYTPLKRVTTLNTVVGAIPGGLPPLMGWTAARGEISGEGWSLFAILCFWQLPHFLAIAWIYRDDYAKAGFCMLPVIDESGERTGRQALCHTLGLLPISLCPFVFKMVGPVYLAGALVLGLAFAGCAFQFARRMSLQAARRLFYASIVYLPVLLALMVFDKIRS